MNGSGNKYQELIALSLRALDNSGQLPQSLQELADLAETPLAEVTEVFPSIQLLRGGLINHGLALLAEDIRQGVVAADPANPCAQIKALARAYFTWGSVHRGLFRIMASALFDPDIAASSDFDLHRNSIRNLVEKKIHESHSLGQIPADRDLGVIMANLHSVVLGISTMLTQGRLDPWYNGPITETEVLALKMIEAFIEQAIPNEHNPTAASR